MCESFPYVVSVSGHFFINYASFCFIIVTHKPFCISVIVIISCPLFAKCFVLSVSYCLSLSRVLALLTLFLSLYCLQCFVLSAEACTHALYVHILELYVVLYLHVAPWSWRNVLSLAFVLAEL